MKSCNLENTTVDLIITQFKNIIGILSPLVILTSLTNLSTGYTIISNLAIFHDITEFKIRQHSTHRIRIYKVSDFILGSKFIQQ